MSNKRRCNFCSKTEDKVEYLIRSEDHESIYICDKCIKVCEKTGERLLIDRIIEKAVQYPKDFFRYYCYHICTITDCKNLESPHPDLVVSNSISERCSLLGYLQELHKDFEEDMREG